MAKILSKDHHNKGRSSVDRPLVLIGGGGHALVVAEAARLAGYQIVGFLDDQADAPLSEGKGKAARLGGMDALERIGERGWILAVGHLGFRAKVLHQLEQLEMHAAATVIHPEATISPTASIGAGVYVGPRAVVHSRAAVHGHAIINTGAIVEHECVIEPNVHIAPGAVLAGRVRVGEGSLVGLNATVLPMLSIGVQCVVGAGSVVVKSVLDKQQVSGVPARVMRKGRAPTRPVM